MFCSKCGKEVAEGSRFCSGCGTPAVPTQQQTAQYVPQQKEPHRVIEPAGNVFLTKDNERKAKASLVLGITGLVTALLLPIVGIPVAIVGLIMGVIGQKSSKKGMALAGLILSIIGVVAGIINAAIGAALGAIGQLF